MRILATTDFDYVRDLLHRRTGIALDVDKSYLVESRLVPVARKHGLPDVPALVDRIRGRLPDAVLDDVLDAMTTNETSWLRDGEPFKVLADDVLPALMQARADSRFLTVWSAGCAFGQEPYSLAMMLEDALTPKGFTFRIVATDISGEAVQRAEAGVYHQLEINRGLPAPLLVRHFHRDGVNWRINEATGRHVSFARHNLVDDPPPISRVDVVLLRNVLIYFDLPTRRRVLEKVRSVLAPDGVLILGAAETTLGLSDGWERTQYGRTTVNRTERPKTPTGAPTRAMAPEALTQIGTGDHQ